MIKVICTVVIMSSSGYRHVYRFDGIMVNERTHWPNEQILVDFSKSMSYEPTSRWVDENECLYYEDPSKHYDDYLKLREFWNKQSEEDKRTHEHRD